jgi:methyl-accepting chemotaxis protein
MGIRKAFERAGLGLDSFSGLLDGLWTVLKIVWNVLKPVVNLFTDLIAFCLRPLVWALKQVISGLKAFFDFLKDSYNWLADSFVGRNMGLEKMVDAPAPVPATSEERYRQALEAGHPKATPWQDPNAPGELWTPQRLESLDRAATGGQPGGVVPMAVSGPPDPQLMGVFNSINDRLKTLVELFQKGIPITGSVSLADRSLTTFMDTVSAAAMTTTGKGVTADVNVKPLETVDRRLKEIGADLPPPVAMLKAMGRMYTWLGEYSRVMAHWINLGQTFSTAANTYVKEILPVVSTGMAGISDSVKKFADAISAEMQKVKTSVTTLEKATLEQMVGQVTELGKALERIAAGKLPNVADIKAGMDRLVVWAAGVRTVLRAVTEVPTSRFAAEGLTHGFRYVLDQLKATLDGIQIDVDKQVVPLAAQVADIIKKLDQVVGANLPDASDVRTRLQFLTGWAAEIRNALRAVVEVPTGRFAAEGLAPGFRYAVDELQRNIDAIALSLKPLDLTKLNVIKAFDADVVSRLPSKELLLRSWGRVRDYVRGVADLLPTIAEQMAALKASTVAAQERAATIGCDFRAMTDGLRKAFSFLDPTVLAGLGSSLRADALAALPTRNEMTGIFTAIMARIQSLASAMPELLDRFKQSLAQMKSGIAAGLEMGPQFRSLVNEFKTAFSFLDLSAFRSLGQVWGVGPGLALPSPDSLLRTFEFIRDWMMEVVGLMDKRLRPMVRDMRETITDSILKRGKEMAASLQTMVGGVGSIFSAIKLAGLEEVFQRMGKSLSKSLPPAESLEDMFGYLRTWMRTVIQKVLPKMAAITDEATGELSVAIADGVVKSQDLGRVIGELGTLFDKTNVSRLHQSVKDFVRSFRTPLPDAEEISDHLTGLIEWVKNLFGTTSPFSGLSDGLTAIQTQAAEFVRAANQFGDALNTVRQIFDKMNPGDALSAWRQLARRAAGKMPDASEIREVVGRIRQFVQDTGTVFPAVGQSITPPPQTVSPTIGRPLGTPAVSTGGLPAPIPGSLYVHDIHVDRLLNAAMPTIAVGSPQVTGLDSMPANVEPTAVAPTVAEPVPMGLEAVESRIEQQLASAEPSPAIALATQHLNEIAANTRNTAEGVRAVNSTLANILAVLGGGGKGGSAADADTRTNDMPTSTPIWPRLMYNANGGARKRYLQVGV